MKEIKKSGAQGDVIFRRVKALPNGVVEKKIEGEIIVAHSETGHHHVAESPGEVAFFSTKDPLVSYLRVKGEYADIVHHRPWDTHETLRLLSDGTGEGETIWEIGRQREWTPEGYRIVAD